MVNKSELDTLHCIQLIKRFCVNVFHVFSVFSCNKYYILLHDGWMQYNNLISFSFALQQVLKMNVCSVKDLSPLRWNLSLDI